MRLVITMRLIDHDVVDPEIRGEREFMELCRAQLISMRDEVGDMLARRAAEGDGVGDKYFNHALREFRKKVIESLSGFDDAPLFFGRMDYPPGEVYEQGEDGGARQAHTRRADRDLVYVGRRGVRDDDGEPVVIDWRAPLARAFYEASPRDPMGVRVRRRYGFDHGGALTAFEDEPLTGAAPAPSGGGLLAREIERPRQGPMRDIVATIQPEQMRLVRADVGETLCVQGAPGTGKTAVGLHRLAYLLFSARDKLRRDGGVAVIGPNLAFLAHIRTVLPALGEAEVVQSTIDDITGPGIAVGRVDDPAAARVKGDLRMAEVLARHVWSQLREPDTEAEIQQQQRIWRLTVDDQADELAAVRSRGLGYGTGRDLLAQRLAHVVLRRIEQRGTEVTLAQLTRSRAITQAVRRMWPPIDPARVVFDLLTTPSVLASAAEGILTAEEQRSILLTPRPRSAKSMPWSSLDLALLDEVAAMVERPDKLGHVMVDEAQDLSPMHFRAIGRRLAGACTVLGDLAQATSPSAVRDWPEVLRHLDRPDGKVDVLERGYRVPAEVIDYAARLLPHIAPGLAGPASFRHSADALHVRRTARLSEAVVETCRTALAGDGSICVITADADVEELRRTFVEEDLPHTVLGEELLEPRRLTLAPVTLTKGLEYDTVLVLEPARIVAAEPQGLQRLYVALTRAVSVLHVIHAQDLPAPLVSGSAGTPATAVR
ncbi:AAA family ATPase [Lentzea sp. NPDC003310]|uniref:HelD family protein n=1 Tax=Lentzea sp. NPDC003310 TaxID=3154447 RepID=UPI0033B3F8E0